MKKYIFTFFVSLLVTTNLSAIDVNKILSQQPNNNETYYNNRTNYHSTSLIEQLYLAEDEIDKLKHEVKELKDNLEYSEQEIDSLHSINTGLWITASILFIISTGLIIITLKKRK